jgi:hypothetical protein
MRSHLNTLYVTTQGSWLNKDGADIVVSVDGAEKGRMPAHLLGGVVCFGRVALSSPLLGYCAEEGICVTHLSEHGRFLARLEGPVSGNVLLRREQYRRTDEPTAAAAIAAGFVAGKTLNQRAVLRRALRDHGEALDDEGRCALQKAEARLSDVARRSTRPQSLDGCAGWKARPGKFTSAFSITSSAPRKTPFASPAVRAGRRSMRSMPCSRCSTRCSCTIAARRWKRSGLILRWVFCIAIVPVGRVSRSRALYRRGSSST